MFHASYFILVVILRVGVDMPNPALISHSIALLDVEDYLVYLNGVSEDYERII